MTRHVPTPASAEARTPRGWGWQGRVALLLAGVAAGLFVWAGEDRVTGDELDIIRPALAYMAGDIRTDVKYPSFPFYFYGIFLSLFGAPDDLARNLAVARTVHAGIGGTNVLLMYLIGRQHFDRSWALVSALFYLAIPIVLFSAAQVKTESLQVLELLVTLLAIGHVNRAPTRRRWHLLAGAAAATSLATKLNLFPALLYGLNLLYLRRRDDRFEVRGMLLCGLAFLATALLVWTNLWVFDRVLDGWARDQYFQPNASIMRAVDETWAFPYGRYSSFFFSTLPLCVGWPMLVLAGLSCRAGSGWSTRVLGLGTLLYLLVALSGTLLRIAHAFTPFLPFFALGSVSTLQALGARPGRWQRATAAGLAVLVVAYTGFVASGVPAMRRAERERDALMAAHAKQGSFLTLMESERRDLDTVPIRTRVEALAPATLMTVNSYFLNMCKYRNSPLYRDNCAYHADLLAGRTPYRAVKAIRAHLPGAMLQLDPEVREMTYYLLQRTQPASPAPRPDAAPGP